MTTFTSWENELYHHGVKGQEHGIRRYQNEDGSLTTLGRIHYGIGQARERAARKKEERKKRAEVKRQNRPKKLSEMTDEELRSAIARKNLENEYRTASANTLVKIANKIGDAYDKYQERSLRREELKVEAQKALSEAKKAESDRKKAVAEKAKANSEKKIALYKRRTDKKTLRKAATTADLEAAMSKKFGAKATYTLAQSKSDSYERILNKRKLWKQLAQTDLASIINSYGSNNKNSGNNDNKNKK